MDQGYENIELVVRPPAPPARSAPRPSSRAASTPTPPSSGSSTPSPECVELAAQNGSYQFLVIDNAEQLTIATEFGLDPNNTMDYDFEDAKENTDQYVADVMEALGGGDDRFETEDA